MLPDDTTFRAFGYTPGQARALTRAAAIGTADERPDGATAAGPAALPPEWNRALIRAGYRCECPEYATCGRWTPHSDRGRCLHSGGTLGPYRLHIVDPAVYGVAVLCTACLKGSDSKRKTAGPAPVTPDHPTLF